MKERISKWLQESDYTEQEADQAVNEANITTVEVTKVEYANGVVDYIVIDDNGEIEHINAYLLKP